MDVPLQICFNVESLVGTAHIENLIGTIHSDKLTGNATSAASISSKARAGPTPPASRPSALQSGSTSHQRDRRRARWTYPAWQAAHGATSRLSPISSGGSGRALTISWAVTAGPMELTVAPAATTPSAEVAATTDCIGAVASTRLTAALTRILADFSPFGAAVWVNLGAGGVEAWTRGSSTLASGAWRQIADLTSIENLVGTLHSDSLTGNASDNAFTYTGGRDLLDGGAGSDTASFADFGSAVWVQLGYSGLEAWTRDGATVTTGTWCPIADLNNMENLVGTSRADQLAGDANANALTRGGGNDLLTGGEGADRFDYDALGEGLETITDFTRGAGGDRLDSRCARRLPSREFGHQRFRAALQHGQLDCCSQRGWHRQRLRRARDVARPGDERDAAQRHAGARQFARVVVAARCGSALLRLRVAAAPISAVNLRALQRSLPSVRPVGSDAQ